MIFYLVPHNDSPSWGLGILFAHITILNSNNISAKAVLIDNKKINYWYNYDGPRISLNQFYKEVTDHDTLVVPEVLMDAMDFTSQKCKKILFIQNASFIFQSLPIEKSHRDLGFEHVFINMPHMSSIVSKFLEIDYTLIPPFIPKFFFRKYRQKKLQIVLYPKFNQLDFNIVRRLLTDYIDSINKKSLFSRYYKNNWRVVELRNFSHNEVSKILLDSEIFISLNTFESLNASVVEAMASGAVVFCYDALGPNDYLIDQQNAFVFKNNDVYTLINSVIEYISKKQYLDEKIESLRQNAIKTSNTYKRQFCENALLDFFN